MILQRKVERSILKVRVCLKDKSQEQLPKFREKSIESLNVILHWHFMFAVQMSCDFIYVNCILKSVFLLFQLTFVSWTADEIHICR